MASFTELLERFTSGAHAGSIVGIDMGTSSIKVVEIAKEDERAVLRNYGEIALGPLADVSVGQATSLSQEKLSTALRDILREMGVTVEHSAFAIPFSASLLTIVDLPDVSKSELETMVPFEARRYIPVPIAEVTLNWWVLPKVKEANVTPVPDLPPGIPPEVQSRPVIIAAVHNDVFKKLETLKKDVGLPEKASHFEIEVFSTLRSAIGRDLSPTLVMDIGAGTTKLALIAEGVVWGSHTISMGGQNITSALSKSLNIPFERAEEIKRQAGMLGNEEGRDVAAVSELILANMFTEAKRTVEEYERRYGRKIEKVILVGGGAAMKGILHTAALFFKNLSVTVGNPFARVEFPPFLAKTIGEISPAFSVAIGVALKGLEE
ncbi:MAG: Type IV pilus assembly protein PilM [Parcubacteria group bacterium GW2011_GWA1_47_8]|nr:MAG: Type IV pilus assembly protein PilM [Parcubacteria group bacterium GW2011_GWA1_47_8]KKW07754.1 MAG: Type IV pilus assembly protein PilM [Parcubacteria group bacterium GW2011_GWA2_49_16]